MLTTLSSQFDPAAAKATKAHICARNTFERWLEGGDRVIRLHATDILHFSANGKKVKLNSGGYRTLTTRGRLNDYLPGRYHITTDRGFWTVHDTTTARSVPYYDYMVLPDAFSAKALARADRAREQEAKLQKKIAEFVKLVPYDGPLPMPNGGDCWHCSMFAKPHNNKYYGYPTSGPRGEGGDHLREHIREGYMHGSLILNALRWHGAGNPELWLRMGGTHGQVRRIVRRYLQASLGLGCR